MANIVMVLYPDPVSGYPPVYARDSVPVIHGYPGGQSLPSPSALDFTPVNWSAACPARWGCASSRKTAVIG